MMSPDLRRLALANGILRDAPQTPPLVPGSVKAEPVPQPPKQAAGN